MVGVGFRARGFRVVLRAHWVWGIIFRARAAQGSFKGSEGGPCSF